MPITKNKAHTSRSEQAALNKSMDDDFDVLAAEMMEYSPAPSGGSASLKRAVTPSLTLAFEYDGSNPIYIGKAPIGTSKSTAKWQIQKLTYTGDNLTDRAWADGDDSFDNVWDDRASLSYS